MTIWFTSDHHFDHKNVIKYCNRPFDSIEGMNEEMVKRWNERVSSSDTVYYIGDFSLSFTAVEKYLNRLNGMKYLIMGNHDKCHPCFGKNREQSIQKYINHGFLSVELSYQFTLYLKSNTLHVLMPNILQLHHMPYINHETDKERYLKYRPIDTGEWLLHGHVHDKWLVKDKMINVGVDVWNFYPVSLEQISGVIKETELIRADISDEEIIDKVKKVQ